MDLCTAGRPHVSLVGGLPKCDFETVSIRRMADPYTKLEQISGGLRCAAISDVGMRRASNQDSLALALADSPHQYESHGHLFVVADGMGAHAAGELASELATDNIPHSYQKLRDLSPSEAIVEAVRYANGVIHNKGQNSIDFHGMGTTCSSLLLLPCGAIAAHVGDSRIYRLRGDLLEQLTFDHSLVWEMAAEGHASEEEIPAYVPKNVITRSLGPNPTVAVDVEGPFDLQAGDRFLLCSDGLTGPLQPELIGMVIGSLPPIEATQTLVDLANLLGGPDNITVVIAEVVEPDQLGKPAPDQLSHSSILESRAPTGSVHPLLWATGLLSAIVLSCGALLDFPILAILGGIALAISSAMAWMQYTNPQSSGGLREEVGLRGKAPYRRHACSPNPSRIQILTEIVRQLEELEFQREWKFDWKQIHEDRGVAHKAMSQGDYSGALIAYCSAVRGLMQAIRESQEKPPGDSSINFNEGK